MPRFSIITVCFNAVESIEKTIQSVVNQDYKDYEYIIIDGASTDGTLAIIERYSGQYDSIRYVSEKDEGLYDAMNKGVAKATGEYIEFINAGDCFYDNKVLSRVEEHILREDRPDKSMILYGNIIYMNEDGSEDLRIYGKSCGKPIYYATGDCINHQACFTSRDCFEGDGNDFDYITYKICADRDWMMRQSRKGAAFVATGECLVKYSLDGNSVSVRDKELLRSEERLCIKKNYPAMYPIYACFDFCRNNAILARLLHSLYGLLYIRK